MYCNVRDVHRNSIGGTNGGSKETKNGKLLGTP